MAELVQSSSRSSTRDRGDGEGLSEEENITEGDDNDGCETCSSSVQHRPDQARQDTGCTILGCLRVRGFGKGDGLWKGWQGFCMLDRPRGDPECQERDICISHNSGSHSTPGLERRADPEGCGFGTRFSAG